MLKNSELDILCCNNVWNTRTNSHAIEMDCLNGILLFHRFECAS